MYQRWKTFIAQSKSGCLARELSDYVSIGNIEAVKHLCSKEEFKENIIEIEENYFPFGPVIHAIKQDCPIMAEILIRTGFSCRKEYIDYTREQCHRCEGCCNYFRGEYGKCERPTFRDTRINASSLSLHKGYNKLYLLIESQNRNNIEQER